MKKIVKYSWLSAKRNPEMIKDYFIKELKKAEINLNREERLLNNLNIKFIAKNYEKSDLLMNTKGDYEKVIEIKITDLICPLSTKMISNILISPFEMEEKDNLVDKGYYVLLEILNKFESNIPKYRETKERLRKIKEEYDYFLRKYY